MTAERSPRSAFAINLLIVLALGAALASLYGPLLLWLGREAMTVKQLQNGGLIVLFALVISLRKTIRAQRFQFEANNLGIGLLVVGVACLYLVRIIPAYALPVALLSFCLSFAGVASFLFGAAGVRALLPAIVGILLLGLLAGLAPSLDWPLRGLGARLGHYFLQKLGVDVNVAFQPGEPPALILAIRDRLFVVAAECNGFGLLTSSLLLAVIMGFHYRLTGLDKLLLLVTAVPVAIVFNALRIVGICVAATRTSLPYDLIHETIGIIFYVVALSLLWWLARRRAEPEEAVSEGGRPKFEV